MAMKETAATVTAKVKDNPLRAKTPRVTVKVAKRIYEMTEEEARGLLRIASDNVRCGIYAIRKGNYIELHSDPMTRTQIKKARNEYRKQGVKVYANGL